MKENSYSGSVPCIFSNAVWEQEYWSSYFHQHKMVIEVLRWSSEAIAWAHICHAVCGDLSNTLRSQLILGKFLKVSCEEPEKYSIHQPTYTNYVCHVFVLLVSVFVYMFSN